MVFQRAQHADDGMSGRQGFVSFGIGESEIAEVKLIRRALAVVPTVIQGADSTK
jgi:hypothetical protein